MSDNEDLDNNTTETKKAVQQAKMKKTPAKKKAVLVSDDAEEAQTPQSPPQKKTTTKKKGKALKKVPSDEEEGADEVVAEKVHVKAKVTNKKPVSPLPEKKNPPPAAAAAKTVAKKNISNDTGTTAPISDGTAAQLLSVDNHMTAALKKRGVVLKKPIHQGKHSTIYKAEMTTTISTVPNTSINASNTPITKTIIAVRVLFLDKIKRDAVRIRQKFLPREIATLCSVHHEGLVTVHEVVRSGARVAVLMELLKDGTLTDYLSENGPMTEPAAAAWFIDLTRALEYLHEECKLAHRNVKTDNILLNGGRVKLSMAAFPLDAWDYDEGRAVLSKTMCGTHQYKSPQLARNLPYDPYAADCWALGVVLFQMLNGKYPFSATNSEGKEALVAQQLDPTHLDKMLIRKNFSPEVMRLLKEGLFVEEEKSRLTARQVLRHAWLKKYAKPP